MTTFLQVLGGLVVCACAAGLFSGSDNNEQHDDGYWPTCLPPEDWSNGSRYTNVRPDR